ncbi:hypothetical protein HOG48_03200 [Candidatus Peregrinibacteria bacterium]|jgi:hypothetical protein|nr:hypothetical protein [Candidatus Peregrinibacteria bacterium]
MVKTQKKERQTIHSLIRPICTFILAVFLITAIIPTIYAAELEPEFSNTPVQILDISQSEFNLFPNDIDYLSLTLINLTKEKREIQMETVDAIDVENGIYQEGETKNSLMRDLVSNPGTITLKPESILQLPLSIKIPEDIEERAFYGALIFRPANNIEDPLDVRVLQPLKINIQDQDLIISNLGAFPYSPIITAILLIALIYYFSRKRYGHITVIAIAIAVMLILIILYQSLINLPAYLHVNSLTESATPNADLLVDDSIYDYESDEALNYLELYGNVISGAEDVEIDAILEDDIIVGALTHDLATLSSGTEEVDATSMADISATPEVGVGISDDLDEIDEMISERYFYIESEEIKWLHPDYNGMEAPIIKGVHIEYNGLEKDMLNILATQHVDRKIIRWYAKKILSLTGNGKIRKTVKNICYDMEEIKKEAKKAHKKDKKGKEIDKEIEYIKEHFKDIKKLVHKMLKDEPLYNKKTVNKFLDKLLKNTRNLKKVTTQANIFCNNFEKAHKRAIKFSRGIRTKDTVRVVKLILQRKNGTPKLVAIFTNIEMDDDLLALVENYPATGPVRILIQEIKAQRKAKKNQGSIQAENTEQDNEESQTEEEEEDIREFELETVDLENNNEEDGSNEENNNHDENENQNEEENPNNMTICHKPGTRTEATLTIPNQAWYGHSRHGDTVGACPEDDNGDNGNGDEDNTEEEATVIEVDLAPSDIVELTVPAEIYLPSLTAKPDAYISKSNLGEFRLETFYPDKTWRGFFSIEVIELKNHVKLDEMWMEINGQRLDPVESYQGDKKYIQFYISDELFPFVEQGLYNFSPVLDLLIPEYSPPGNHESTLSFTLIQ